MEHKPSHELRDPKLPRINAGTTGNGMESRRCSVPLPQSLDDALIQQNLSI